MRNAAKTGVRGDDLQQEELQSVDAGPLTAISMKEKVLVKKWSGVTAISGEVTRRGANFLALPALP